ncbi:MAG TPA: hypothetical protein VFJ96_01225 [Gemmatimonadaceae bacterium]|jgi:Tol biopolymer transport system component|nr:hypothetical protein [Gemmatimonadaceae bacterium]
MMLRRAVVVLAALLAGAAATARAQVVPNAHWKTIRTEHFYVHFTPAVEVPARRAAVDAEQAYAALAQSLQPPRGPIDLVVADNVDFSNGFTTVFPTNRIVIYAHPPLDDPSLRFYNDWIALVITHELTHVFHLDRAGGWWGIAQHVFGRAPFLFPNQYQPAWIIEGLAVYYESAITGAGRVQGTHERMLVDASVAGSGLLGLGQWSLASTRYPGGESAYAFGSLFLAHLADAHGPHSIATFVDRSSGNIIPFFLLNRDAKRSFGISFTQAWRNWRDSLAAHADQPRAPLPSWRDLTRRGYVVAYPRWLDSTSLIYAGYNWKAMPGAYRVDTAGKVQRLGRRNGTDVNVPLPDGSLLFSQLEYTDAYHVRSDLYVQRGGHEERLTHGARISQPDVRADGWIVAVQSVPATTQLVRVSPDGRHIIPITPAVLDTQWAEPRWSPSGDRIAVTRWTRGGYADIVVIDTAGHLVREITHDRAFDSSPSWTPDGRSVLFTSDRTGTADVYMAVVEPGPLADGDADTMPQRLSRATLGLFYPSLSPAAQRIAAVRYEADGWHAGIAPFDTTGAEPTALDTARFAPVAMGAAQLDTSRAHDYSPWRSLLPRYWFPLVGTTALDDYSVGAFTSGSDIVGRHAYYAQALIDPSHGENEYDVAYSYAGLGQPVLAVSGQQFWDRLTVVDTTGARVGDLHRRSRALAVSATVTRPRYRTYSWASVGGELEWRAYTTSPAPILDKLPDFYRSSPMYRSLLASAGWSNVQHPALAISPEDGITLAVASRLQWLAGSTGLRSESVSGVLEGYKSIDAGGFAHHVLAARVAAGYANGTDVGEFDIGGTSGTPVSIIPGLSLGTRRTFAVRGFPSGAQSGTRAATGSLEYRAPLFQPGMGLSFLPVFLDRVSIALFGDAGSAWTDNRLFGTFSTNLLASVGGELNFDTAWQYDVPYRLRLGVAVPVVDHSLFKTSPVSVYVRLGVAF